MSRVVVVGAGFAGYQAARRLSRKLPSGSEVVLVNPFDYFLYVPLLPHVMSGAVEPRRVAVSLAGSLPNVRRITGTVASIDLAAHQLSIDPLDGGSHQLEYDHVVLTSGSVTKLLPIPGVADHAMGFRNLAEAVYLRDHIIRQLELADTSDDADERSARLTFVVVGAGYTGTEVAAHGARLTRQLLRRHPRLTGVSARWMLLDTAAAVLPGLRAGLGRGADKRLRRLGVDVRMGTSVKEATHDGVTLTDGTAVPTRSLVWCVGVRPDPVPTTPTLDMDHGRVTVDPTMAVDGHEGVWACGDLAAVPDVHNPGQVTPMTAQHAQRQGVRVADNVLATVRGRSPEPYSHRALGFVVDLGGAQAVADPLGISLGGWPAAIVTRGYHLAAMPGNRLRTMSDWLVHAVQGTQEVQLQLAGRPKLPMPAKKPDPHKG